jgi:hypothetical protein
MWYTMALFHGCHAKPATAGGFASHALISLHKTHWSSD